jgi:hypothetical protein
MQHLFTKNVPSIVVSVLPVMCSANGPVEFWANAVVANAKILNNVEIILNVLWRD